jgi:very-short-patch-repair endonuclease
MELKLIIEVDGWTHTMEEVAIKDALRQQALENEGFTVIRFNDDEVLEDINGVIKAIEDTVDLIRDLA